MKKIFKYIISFSVIIFSAFCFVACTNSSKTASYNISVLEPSYGGSISISKTSAKAGEAVDITVSPDDGYDLLYVIYNGHISYTNQFTMPTDNVSVTAVFRKRDTEFILRTGNYYIDKTGKTLAESYNVLSVNSDNTVDFFGIVNNQFYNLTDVPYSKDMNYMSFTLNNSTSSEFVMLHLLDNYSFTLSAENTEYNYTLSNSSKTIESGLYETTLEDQTTLSFNIDNENKTINLIIGDEVKYGSYSIYGDNLFIFIGEDEVYTANIVDEYYLLISDFAKLVEQDGDTYFSLIQDTIFF